MSSPILIPDLEDDTSSSCTLPEDVAIAQHNLVLYDRNSECSKNSLKLLRERDGRCADCGLQTHVCYTHNVWNREMKVPLTIPNEVYRGRCLMCHPIRSQLCNFQGGTNLHGSDFGGISMVPSERKELPTEASDLVEVLHTMKYSLSCEKIQEEGCRMLWVQCWDEETSSIIGRIGGIDRILDAMMRHPANAKVQYNGCEALQNLAQDVNNRADIVNHGGAALVVQAMILHLDSIDVQQSGCRALTSLATSTELRADIVKAGGEMAIFHSLKRYSHVRSINFYAIEAIASLRSKY